MTVTGAGGVMVVVEEDEELYLRFLARVGCVVVVVMEGDAEGLSFASTSSSSSSILLLLLSVSCLSACSSCSSVMISFLLLTVLLLFMIGGEDCSFVNWLHLVLR